MTRWFWFAYLLIMACWIYWAVALLKGQTNTLGRFPVADPVAMTGKDCK